MASKKHSPRDKRQRKKQGRQARQEELRARQRRAERRRRLVAGLGLVVVVAVVATFAVRGGGGGKAKRVSAKGTTTTAKPAASGTAPCPPADGSAARRTTFDGPPRRCTKAKRSYRAEVETDVGAFTVAFDGEKAPATVNNFVFLARYHFYDGVVFHRVIPGFVVQGGDPEGTGRGGPGYQFADELPEKGEYEVGSLAMANSGRDTNGSQFFVVTGPQGTSLDPNYSLFGKVTKGLDVVKKIEADGSPSGTPKVVHKMTRVTITES